MTQRLAIAATAGIIAFVIVLLSAVAAYVLLAPPAAPTGLPLSASGGPVAAGSAPVPGQPVGGTSGAGAVTGPAISADDAATIALTNAPGAALTQRPRLVNLNGRTAYEVSLDVGFLYVDAGNGQVLYDGTTGARQQPRP